MQKFIEEAGWLGLDLCIDGDRIVECTDLEQDENEGDVKESTD